MLVTFEKVPDACALDSLPLWAVAQFKVLGRPVKLMKTEAGFELEVNNVRLELRRHMLALAESLPTLDFLSRGYTVSAVYLNHKKLKEPAAYNCLRHLASDRPVNHDSKQHFCQQHLDAQIITMPVGATITRKMLNGTNVVVRREAETYDVAFGEIHVKISSAAASNQYLAWIIYERNEDFIANRARLMIYEAAREVAIGKNGHLEQIPRAALNERTVFIIARCIAKGENPLIFPLINLTR